MSTSTLLGSRLRRGRISTGRPKLVLPRPMLHQVKVLASPARFKMSVCGRRWGKTACGLMALLAGHGRRPGDRRGAIDGGNYLWVAPSYPQIRQSEIWKHLKLACAEAVKSLDDIREGDREIRLVNGATIRVMSADGEDSLRGAGLDGLVVDEASRISAEVWGEVLRPMLSDKRGWCLFSSTPNGKNWFEKLFRAACNDREWETWQLPTAENPMIDQAELDSLLKDEGPRKFAQEHLAQFTDIEGAVFPSAYFEDHIWATAWPDKFELSAIFVDPSIGAESKTGDPSAIVFAGLCGGLLYVDADIRQRPPVQIVNDTLAMFDRHNPTLLAVEGNVFQAVLGTLFDIECRARNRPPLPLILVHNWENKGVRIQRLDPHLANKKLRLRRCDGCDTLIEQLQMFPDKGHHDDGPDAIEGAIRVMNQVAVGVR